MRKGPRPYRIGGRSRSPVEMKSTIDSNTSSVKVIAWGSGSQRYCTTVRSSQLSHRPASPRGTETLSAFSVGQELRTAHRATVADADGYGANSSGDIFIAFSTANTGAAAREEVVHAEMLPNDAMSPLFLATVQATEEAIVNAMVAAETMTGINGHTVHALPHDRLIDLLSRNANP